MDEMRLQVNDIFFLINERFGKRFGEAQKSDLDELMEKMTSVSTETTKIRTSVQLTMIRLKALEQTVKTSGSVEIQNGTRPPSPAGYMRRQSNVSVHSTTSERKSRNGRSSKQQVSSDPSNQKKRERHEGRAVKTC